MSCTTHLEHRPAGRPAVGQHHREPSLLRELDGLGQAATDKCRSAIRLDQSNRKERPRIKRHEQRRCETRGRRNGQMTVAARTHARTDGRTWSSCSAAEASIQATQDMSRASARHWPNRWSTRKGTVLDRSTVEAQHKGSALVLTCRFLERLSTESATRTSAAIAAVRLPMLAKNMADSNRRI
eukprot:SAG22_NODE_6_length_41368_cov_49.702222_10_plen_183_part_00